MANRFLQMLQEEQAQAPNRFLQMLEQERALTPPAPGPSIGNLPASPGSAPSAPALSPRPQSSMLGAAAQGLAQGATAGLADEGAAALGALPYLMPGGKSFGEVYDQGLERNRAALHAAEKEHPVASTVGNVAGGLAMPLGMLGTAAKTGLGAIGKGAVGGALGGGAYGFGSGEGAEDRIARTMGGGVLGGVLGGGFAAGAAAVKGIVSALPGAGGKSVGTSMVKEAMKDDETTPGVVASLIEQANRVGKRDVTPVDVAPIGGRTSGLMEGVISNPNAMQPKLKAQLAERQMGVQGPMGEMAKPGQFERLVDDIGEAAGVGGVRQPQFSRVVKEERAATAGPAYEEAWRFDTASSPELREATRLIMKTPLAERAWRRAVNIARTELPDIPVPSREDVIAGRAIPNMQFLHFLKRGMDDAVNAAYKKGDGQTGHSFKNARNAFRDALGAANPAYARANAQFAGDTALDTAATLGRETWNKGPNDMAEAMRGLGQSEQEAFRVGAITRLIDELGSGNAGPSKDFAAKLRLQPNVRDKLALLIPEGPERARFVERLKIEQQMSATSKLPFNSRTQPRQAIRELFEGEQAQGLELAINATSSPIRTALTAIAAKTWKPFADLMAKKRMEQVGGILGSTDERAVELLRQMEARRGIMGAGHAAGPQMAAPLGVAGTQVLPRGDQEELRLPFGMGR
jgi:hypothetical protein